MNPGKTTRVLIQSSFLFFLLLSEPAWARAGDAGTYSSLHEFIPTGNWAYEEIELLEARGRLHVPFLYSRPITRIELAERLVAALKDDPSLRGDISVERLLRELARETDWLGYRSGYTETKPAWEESGGGVLFRTYSYGEADLDYSFDNGFDARPGTRIGARASFYFTPGLYLYNDFFIGKVHSPEAFGEKILGIEDVALDEERAYASLVTPYVNLSLRRDVIKWGAGKRGSLLLSGNSPAYTMVEMSKKLSEKVFLRTLNGILNGRRGRYLAAHRVEFSLSEDFSFAVSEAAMYHSSVPEPLYVVSIVPFTLVERLLRLDAGDDPAARQEVRNNLLASLDFAWRVTPGFQVYGELLADDIVMEETESPNRGGFQLGTLSVHEFLGTRVAFRNEYTRISNYTYSVYYTTGSDFDLDFQHQGKPLGYWAGPDCEEISSFISVDLSRDWRFDLEATELKKGAGRIGKPWDPSMGKVDSFKLSGPVERRGRVGLSVSWFPSDGARVTSGVYYSRAWNAGNVNGRDDSESGLSLGAHLRW